MFPRSHRWSRTIMMFMSVFLVTAIQTRGDSEVSIKILPVKASVLSGTALDIKVEITNRTDRDLLLSRESGHNVSSPVGVYFEIRNSADQYAPETVSAGDCVMNPDAESLPIAVLRRWIALPPRSSLVFTVKLASSPFLAKPGTYKITARYESIGLKEESWTNCVKVTPQELEKLPFNAYEGKLVSNSVTFTVLKSAQDKKTR